MPDLRTAEDAWSVGEIFAFMVVILTSDVQKAKVIVIPALVVAQRTNASVYPSQVISA